MRVLGIDPGLATTGYGLVEGDGHTLEAVTYGVLRTPANTPVAERLVMLQRELATFLDRYRPDVVAMEQLFFGANARTAMTVGEARGVLLLTAAQAGLPIVEYTPLQVKQAITGYGQADKQQIQQMVRFLLGLHEIPQPDDAADGLAISICHHHASRLGQLAAQASEARP